MSNSTNVPDKLPLVGSSFEVLNENPTNADIDVIFKYKITDEETIPAWFLASDNVTYTVVDGVGQNAGKRFVSVNSSHLLDEVVNWGKWGSDADDKDLLNRAAIWGLCAAGQYQEEMMSLDAANTYTIHPFATYKAYMFNSTFGTSAICELPLTGCPQRIIRVHAITNTSNTVTVRAQAGDQLNGTSQGSITLPTNTSGAYYEFHQVRKAGSLDAGWKCVLPVSGDSSDTTPVTTIRRMTQSDYNALSTKDPNTLYVIE
jgi:hypothetical protein